MIEKGQPDAILAGNDSNNSGNMLAYGFPWLYNILRYIPHPKLRAMFRGNPVLVQRGRRAVENSKTNSDSNKNIFSKVLADAEKNDTILSDEEVTIEAGVFIFGGTDTTATTLTYLIWSVLSNSRIQADLEEEVATLEEAYTDEQVEALPLLNAVIKESLRLYGAAPAALPRITPAEGAVLGGYKIPAGTIVATQAWTMHRDPTVFESPDVFDPTRWLSDLASRENVKAAWAPYGAGSRICIGQNLANMELRLATAAFFRECRGATLAESTTPESMEVENTFLIAPKGHACKVIIPTV